MEKYGRVGEATDDNIIRRMRFAFRITKTTQTHSEYAVLAAFSWQKWFRERASTLRVYLYFADMRRLLFCALFYAIAGSYLEVVQDSRNM